MACDVDHSRIFHARKPLLVRHNRAVPFTVSHAAAVLPLRRTRLAWSALVIGSFGPDFEYFLRMSSDSRAWHSYPDFLLYCLPFTVLVFVLFQVLLKKPLTGLLPNGLQRRLKSVAPTLPRTVSGAFWVVVSLLIGISTHIAWDACTHRHTWPTDHIAVLRGLVVLPLNHRMYGWQLFQTFSSVFGLFVLALYFWAWYRRTPPRGPLAMSLAPAYKMVVSCGLVVVAFAAGSWYTLREVGAPESLLHTSSFDVLFVVSAMTWFLWEVVGYSLIVTIAAKTKGTLKPGSRT